MWDVLNAVAGWLWLHHRVIFASITAILAGGTSAYLVAAVLRRLDRGGREPVGQLIMVTASLVIVTLTAATIASRPFANTRGTRMDAFPNAGGPGASVLTEIATALHPADYGYLSAALIFAIGAGLWAGRRGRHPSVSVGNPETSQLLLQAGALLLVTLWVFQRGVEQLKPKADISAEFFGTMAGAGVLAMAIVQGLRTLLPLRGVFHRVTLERWIEDATTAPDAREDFAPLGWWRDFTGAPKPVNQEDLERRRRILRSITRLARGPVSTDRYALLDLPIEQLCGQIAAGADRLLDAPSAATLEMRGSRHKPATVKEVLTALAAGGDAEIDDYLKLAGTMMASTSTGEQPEDGQPLTGGENAKSSRAEAVPPRPDTTGALPDSAQEYVRLRANISQRIQRNIDGLQISTTFWWRRVLRSLVFTVSGVLGLSVFNGSITFTVMCAIVGGFVATASRDLIAVVEKARR